MKPRVWNEKEGRMMGPVSVLYTEQDGIIVMEREVEYTKDIILMENSGLKSGDKHLYEGDIISIKRFAYERIGKIILRGGCFMIRFMDECEIYLHDYIGYPSFKLIGNVFENRELFLN